jgi:hypothetical protein
MVGHAHRFWNEPWASVLSVIRLQAVTRQGRLPKEIPAVPQQHQMIWFLQAPLVLLGVSRRCQVPTFPVILYLAPSVSMAMCNIWMDVALCHTICKDKERMAWSLGDLSRCCFTLRL